MQSWYLLPLPLFSNWQRGINLNYKKKFWIMISHGNLTWSNLGQIKAIKHVDDIITGGARDRGSSSHQEVLTKYLLSKLLGNNPNDSPAFSQRRDSDSSYKFPLVRISRYFIRQHQHHNIHFFTISDCKQWNSCMWCISWNYLEKVYNKRNLKFSIFWFCVKLVGSIFY